MKILSIGNSFSQDAQRYLHQIARADGVNIEAVNLYIPGCLLSHHYRNMLSEEEAYKIEINGMHSGFDVSMKEALLNRDWDVVTIQQGSLKSACYEAYQPYLNKLVEYVRECVPRVHKIMCSAGKSCNSSDMGIRKGLKNVNRMGGIYRPY